MAGNDGDRFREAVYTWTATWLDRVSESLTNTPEGGSPAPVEVPDASADLQAATVGFIMAGVLIAQAGSVTPDAVSEIIIAIVSQLDIDPGDNTNG